MLSDSAEQGVSVRSRKIVDEDLGGVASSSGTSAGDDRNIVFPASGKEVNLGAGGVDGIEDEVRSVGKKKFFGSSFAVKRLVDSDSGQIYWNGGGVWVRPRAEGQTEMEYQMRNWYYFNWLCGDHIVEQHVHNIDVMNWFKGGPPVKAQGMGGREVRKGKDHGEIYDHHYVEFTFADGSVMNSQCRHIRGAMNRVTEVIGCQKGKAYPGRIVDSNGKTVWRFQGKKNDPYQTEHDVLYQRIRENKPINNAYYTAASTMTAILGRMATYSGKELKYEDALNSKISIMPKVYAWDADPGPKAGPDGIYPAPVPGKHKVI